MRVSPSFLLLRFEFLFLTREEPELYGVFCRVSHPCFIHQNRGEGVLLLMPWERNQERPAWLQCPGN